MAELFETYWWLFLVALLIGVIVAWWIFVINDRTRVVTTHAPDALDEGAAPALRNQALIDAPSAASSVEMPPATPEGHAGLGEVVAAAVQMQERENHQSSRPEDDLTRIKGVGPKLNALLLSLGVTSFAGIARWSEADVDRIDARLGNFAGRIRRDNWIEQARYLARDDTEGFEARFGKL